MLTLDLSPPTAEAIKVNLHSQTLSDLQIFFLNPGLRHQNISGENGGKCV